MANDWRATVKEVLDLQADEGMKTAPGPSLQWYPQQWLSDPAVQLMSMTARGCHHHLLMVAWKGFDADPDVEAVPCSLPAAATVLRALCQHPEEWGEVYEEVKMGWKELDGRIWNLGLCRSYLQQMKTRRSKQKGGRARAAQQQESKSAYAESQSANAGSEEADAENGTSSSSSSSSPSPTAGSNHSEEEAAGAAGLPNPPNLQPRKKPQKQPKTKNGRSWWACCEVLNEGKTCIKCGGLKPIAKEPHLVLTPRNEGRAADLTFDAALLQAIPTFQEMWKHSMNIRKNISVGSQQLQIDEFAKFCAEHGAEATIAVLDHANLGSYKMPVFKVPDNGQPQKLVTPPPVWNVLERERHDDLDPPTGSAV